MSRTIKDIQKDIELLGVKGGYSVEQLLTPQDCRRLSYEIDNETRQLECYKADIENANEIIAEAQARIDKAIKIIKERKKDVKDLTYVEMHKQAYIIEQNELLSILEMSDKE